MQQPARVACLSHTQPSSSSARLEVMQTAAGKEASRILMRLLGSHSHDTHPKLCIHAFLHVLLPEYPKVSLFGSLFRKCRALKMGRRHAQSAVGGLLGVEEAVLCFDVVDFPN